MKKIGNSLKTDSIVNLSQIRAIYEKRLTTPKLGSLSKEQIKKVDNALKYSLALS